ncbi:MAG: hypothetical protein KIT15_12275 [Xanthobacteraceae bacterium]|nr:hypothetical protein [Xanthobacteraceae bacterium]MCW5675344.1 hypothetical protein [Xanthobacteraceae bacterium]MCW5676613.1 hypothetical protein [Xanthobacteraceae bacterium]
MKMKEYTLKQASNGAESFTGNGTVYITDGSHIERFDMANFDVRRLDRVDGCEVSIGDAVVVCLEQDCPRLAIASLKAVIARIQKDRRGRRIPPQPVRKDANWDAEKLKPLKKRR